MDRTNLGDPNPQDSGILSRLRCGSDAIHHRWVVNESDLFRLSAARYLRRWPTRRSWTASHVGSTSLSPKWFL